MKRFCSSLFIALAVLLNSQAEEGALRDGMILVEGGTFLMGSTEGDAYEEPVHPVTLSSFYISPYEITQGLWQTVMKETVEEQRARIKMGGKPRGRGWAFPMYNVTWYDAIEFCNKLSGLNGLTPCYSGSGNNITCDFSADGYRLPTEAEWEYAARGGEKSMGYLYAGSNSIGAVAWFKENSALTTREVGSKRPNELGLYDMSGNVDEWCWDRFNMYPSEEQSDPSGSGNLTYRVFRGGSWSHGSDYNRVSFRMAYPPDKMGNALGFRIVRRP